LSADHPFAATLDQMRRPLEQGGGFARLSDQQKWEWHADTYAFRRVCLSAAQTDATPCDPDRRWFNEHLVGIAERFYRAKHAELSRQCKADTDARNAIRFADAERWRNSKEGKDFLGQPVYRRYRDSDISDLHADLGLSAQEYNPSPEQMAEGRRQLGLEDTGERRAAE
jgi:hypothetical protein